jgi:hypothetical protein
MYIHKKDKRATRVKTRVIAAIHPLRRVEKKMKRKKNYSGRFRHPPSVHQQRGGEKAREKTKSNVTTVVNSENSV